MAGVFEFMDIGPDLGTPILIVDRHFPASGAAGMQSWPGDWLSGPAQFDKNTAHVLNIAIIIDYVLVAKQKPEAQPVCLSLGFRA
ncbi:MAG TPA: hypothetical protein VF753_04165 [Terriglobales bacterium]